MTLHNLNHLFIDPYKKGWKNLRKGCQKGHMLFSKRIGHIVKGASLCIPLIGTVVYVSLERLSKKTHVTAKKVSATPTPTSIHPTLKKTATQLGGTSPTIETELEDMSNEEIEWVFAVTEKIYQKNPDLHELRVLLERGKEAYFNRKYDQLLGSTIFHILAAKKGFSSLIDLVMKMGAAPNIRNETENTPLMMAISNANNDSAMEIIRATPNNDPSLNTQCGPTRPLHLVLIKGYTDVSRQKQQLAFTNATLAKELLEKGADPNLTCKDGNTALHIACARRDVEMIRLLLEHRADRNIQNGAGQTSFRLLSQSYEEANTFLENLTGHFLLDKAAFEKNLESAKRCFE